MIFHSEPENFTPKFEVAGCFVEHDGKILLMRRHKDKPQGGTWCVPAGKLDKDEDARTAIVRETLEETGLVIDCDRLNHLKKTFVVYPDYHFVYHVFKVDLNERPGVVLKPDEHVEYKWVTPKEALQCDLIQDEDACIKLVYGC